MDSRPKYLHVFITFARNSLIRDMSFRSNFMIHVVSSLSWVFMNLGFYILIFQYTPSIGQDTGWGKYEFFLFMATGLLINSLVQTFFMPNADEFSDLIRLGDLDFALVKPIDTQFLVSLRRVNWASMGNFVFGLLLLAYSLFQIEYTPHFVQIILYPVYIVLGVVIMYSLMFSLAATSIWLGRNQTLYDFWFYIVNFGRYPMEIYDGRYGLPLRWFFTFIIPILVVINVPARLLALPLDPHRVENWVLPFFGALAAAMSLFMSRVIFRKALESYRSASS